MKSKSNLKWSDLKNVLKDVEQKELINIIRDLYRNSEENRRYLLSIFMEKEKVGGLLEDYKKIIKKEFFPADIDKPIDYAVAEKAISDYSKASGDLEGTMELMLTYVEYGVRYANTYGDINVRFYNKIGSMLYKFRNILLSSEGKEYYPIFRERLYEVDLNTKGIGWGFGDEIGLIVFGITSSFEEEEEEEEKEKEKIDF